MRTRIIHDRYGILIPTTFDALWISGNDGEMMVSGNWHDTTGYIVYASVPFTETAILDDAFITEGYVNYGSRFVSSEDRIRAIYNYFLETYPSVGHENQVVDNFENGTNGTIVRKRSLIPNETQEV